MSEWTIWAGLLLTGWSVWLCVSRSQDGQAVCPLFPLSYLFWGCGTVLCRRCAEVQLDGCKSGCWSRLPPRLLRGYYRGVVWHDVLIESCDEPYAFHIEDAPIRLSGIPSVFLGAR